MHEETKEFEGGYYPEREGYKTDRKGFLILDDKGNPVIEKGLIKKGMEGIEGRSQLFASELVLDDVQPFLKSLY